MAKKENVSIEQIQMDSEHQARAKVNRETIKNYKELLEENAGAWLFPPVELIREALEDGTFVYWVIDGWHRLISAREIGYKETDKIPAMVTEGTHTEAIIASLGANAAHGLHRSSADKKNAIRIAFNLPEIQLLSNREIADICKVSDKTVGTYRAELESEGLIPIIVERKSKDGITRKISRHGGKKKEDIEADDEAEENANDIADELEQQEGPTYDKHGREVPESLRPYFDRDAMELRSAVKSLRLARSVVNKIVKGEHKELEMNAALVERRKEFESPIKESIQLLESFLIFDNVCPYCKATDSECPVCHGFGVVCDADYVQAPAEFQDTDKVATKTYWKSKAVKELTNGADKGQEEVTETNGHAKPKKRSKKQQEETEPVATEEATTEPVYADPI